MKLITKIILTPFIIVSMLIISFIGYTAYERHQFFDYDIYYENNEEVYNLLLEMHNILDTTSISHYYDYKGDLIIVYDFNARQVNAKEAQKLHPYMNISLLSKYFNKLRQYDINYTLYDNKRIIFGIKSDDFIEHGLYYGIDIVNNNPKHLFKKVGKLYIFRDTFYRQYKNKI